jgi:hypothetical protein
MRNLALKYHFQQDTKQFDPKMKTFQYRSTWTPGTGNFPIDIQKTINSIQTATQETLNKRRKIILNDNEYVLLSEKNNLTREEMESLKQLKNVKDIIIKPADKGGATVIMDKTAYVTEAMRQLNNSKYYKEIDTPLYPSTRLKIKNVLTHMFRTKKINKKQLEYLTGPINCRNRIFYLLPKIHKPKVNWPQKNMPEGRPIVSDVDSESYRISEYVDYHINKLACQHPSYIKNTYEFIKQIRNKNIGNKDLIVTGDVSSLYTNMNINRTIACTKRALAMSRANNQNRPDREIVKLLDLTLNNNDFEFNGKHYLQTCGTAMGKKYAPALANLYLLDFDAVAMKGLLTDHGQIVPKYYKRYLDDVFFIWSGTLHELQEFESNLNKVTEGIKIAFEHHDQELSFLDTTIYKKTIEDTTTIQTRVFFKKTDTHQLLHTDSFHPKHTTRGILKSQLIRFKRISSCKEDYNTTCNILFKTLINRGYTRTEIRKQQQYVWDNHEEREPETQDNMGPENNINLLPMVINYDGLGTELNKKYRGIVQKDEFFKSLKIITAYTNHVDLRRQLVHSKLN